MGTRDWLAGWSRRHARVLVEVEIPGARGALVDTNHDGRELWFALDLLDPEGEWFAALDWDDVGAARPVGSLDGGGFLFGWGQDRAGRRKIIEHDGNDHSTRVGRFGWWLLIAEQRDPDRQA